MAQAAGHTNSHTEEEYYRLPEHVRAELIDGQFYYMSAPSRFVTKSCPFYMLRSQIISAPRGAHARRTRPPLPSVCLMTIQLWLNRISA